MEESSKKKLQFVGIVLLFLIFGELLRVIFLLVLGFISLDGWDGKVDPGWQLLFLLPLSAFLGGIIALNKTILAKRYGQSFRVFFLSLLATLCAFALAFLRSAAYTQLSDSIAIHKGMTIGSVSIDPTGKNPITRIPGNDFKIDSLTISGNKIFWGSKMPSGGWRSFMLTMDNTLTHGNIQTSFTTMGVFLTATYDIPVAPWHENDPSPWELGDEFCGPASTSRCYIESSSNQYIAYGGYQTYNEMTKSRRDAINIADKTTKQTVYQLEEGERKEGGRELPRVALYGDFLYYEESFYSRDYRRIIRRNIKTGVETTVLEATTVITSWDINENNLIYQLTPSLQSKDSWIYLKHIE